MYLNRARVSKKRGCDGSTDNDGNVYDNPVDNNVEDEAWDHDVDVTGDDVVDGGLDNCYADGSNGLTIGWSSCNELTGIIKTNIQHLIIMTD